jgi:2-dehydropantoate 2-reductase
VILLSCKAFDLSQALEAIAPAVGPGEKHVLGGLTWESGVLAPNGDIVRAPLAAKIGMTALGELDGQTSDRCQAILNAFVAGGVKANISATIMADMWTKFSTFVSSATIATLCRSRSGAIASAPTVVAFVSAVLEECNRVVSAEGYPMPASSIALIRDLYSHPGSQYCPSILGDMEKNRPTEAEHTIGDMVDRALRHGINAPILTAARCNLEVYEAQQRAA